MDFDWCFGTSVPRSYGNPTLPMERICAARTRSYTPARAAKQGGFSFDMHLILYAREAAAQAAQLKRRYRKVRWFRTDYGPLVGRSPATPIVTSSVRVADDSIGRASRGPCL